MSNFIVSVPLYVPVNSLNYKRLKAKFNVAHHLYNAFLRECIRRKEIKKNLPSFKEAVKNKYDLKLDESTYKDLFKQAKIDSGYSEYTLIKEFAQAIAHKNTFIYGHIGSVIRNQLMSIAFSASENANPRFRSFVRDPILSLYTHHNSSPIRLDIKNKNVIFGPRGKYEVVLPIANTQDEKLEQVNKWEYIKIKRRFIKGFWHYYADIVCDGTPLTKAKYKDLFKASGTVGIDIGPGTIAIVSDNKIILRVINDGVLDVENKKTLQNSIKRKARKNKHRIIKNGNPIVSHKLKSKKQIKQERLLAELQRKIADARKINHGKLTNEIRSLGDIVKVDNDNFKTMQKVFGKSIGKHAPGLLIQKLHVKMNNTGGKLIKINTFESISSQICPNCGVRKKKLLQERIHKCSCGFQCQRDITSAIVNKFYNTKSKTLDLDESKKFIAEKRWLLADTHQEVIQFVRVRKHNMFSSTFGKLSELEQIVSNGVLVTDDVLSNEKESASGTSNLSLVASRNKECSQDELLCLV